jgi:hypothetical protein
MLVIRREQMKALADARYRSFTAEACRHCRLRHPDMCALWDGGKLRSIVEEGLRRARSYGFEAAADFIRFLDLVITQGVDFDESDWAAPILAEQRYLPKTRLDVLFRTLDSSQAATPPPPEPPAIRDASWPAPEPQPAPTPPAPPTLDENSTPPPPARKWGQPDHEIMSVE